ncbi:MAG: DegV family protein [Bacillota bacterium]
MEKIKIFTDSCSDLPDEILNKYNIEMISTPVNFGAERYKDRSDLKPKDFYKKLNESDEIPNTSRISPTIFMNKFEKALAEGYKVLSINFSSELSGIFESAVIAKNNINSEDIKVIDSKSASTGFGLSVLKAARAKEEGKSFEEIIKITKNSCEHMEHIFAVGSLEMLKRGGRISSPKAFVANVLNIKPILHFENGKIKPLDKVRGKKRMFKFLLDIMEKRGHNLDEQIIGLNYSANKELAEKLKEKIQEKYDIPEFFISEIGAAIGSHVGHNTVSVFFMNKEKVADVQVL